MVRKTLLILAGLVSADAAVGQTITQRCGGWPHSPGQPGLIIAPGGEPCRGRLFRTRFGPGEIVDVQADTLLSRGGTLLMRSPTEFDYSPASGQRGYERIRLMVTGAYRGMTRTFPVIYLATTEEEFRASGGTNTSPPPGFTGAPWQRRELLMR